MRIEKLAAAVLMTLVAAIPISGAAEDKAPMPQTKGMQGMDATLHDKWAKEGQQEPEKDCKPNADKAAQQAGHPMPDTRGMKGMDPKAHEVDCPGAKVTKADPNEPPKHVHKAPGN